MKILTATNNLHKIEEINQILIDLDVKNIEICSPSQLYIKIDVLEDGKTFFENASKKARAFFEISKIPVIADDSGLLTDYLNGLPGVDSAVFAGKHGDDRANRQKLLELMSNAIDEERNARFLCIICFYDGKDERFFEGKVEGRIEKFEKGTNGFGYDSVFVPNGYDLTFAELDNTVKNSISHRRNALMKFVEYLKNNQINE